MGKKLNIIVLISVLFLLLTSCGSSSTQAERDIEARFSLIDNLINENLLNVAKIELDSIHILHPRALDARRKARVLQDTVVVRENLRNLAFLDSLLPIRQHQADSIGRNFRFEKDERFQTVGNFVYRQLTIEQNFTRNYLRAFVDENADFLLVSHFTGSNRNNHTSVRASVGELFATTDTIPLSSPFNHAFTEGGTTWETITFRNETAGNLPAFIAQYPNERIRIELTGGRGAVYFLTEMDRRALAETYNFWVALRDVRMLEREIERANAVIEHIRTRN